MAPNKIQIERDALGRVYSLGDLYDARSDSFLSINIFRKPLPPEFITILKSPSTKTDFSFTSSTSEKLEMMKFDAELSLSFLCGMITVEGSAKFLDKNVNNSKFVHCVLSQKIQTQREFVNLAQDGIEDLFKMEVISDHVTHVVVGIKRGCNSFVDFCFKSDEKTSKREIEGMLKGALAKKGVPLSGESTDSCNSTSIGGNVSASAGGQYNSDNKEIKTDVNLEVFADVVSPTNSTPQTVDEGVDYVREIAQKMGNTANGPGVAISYELFSVQEMKRLLGNEDLTILFNELSKVTVEKAKGILCEGEEQLQKLNAFVEKVKLQENLIPEGLLDEVTRFQEACNLCNIETREKIHHNVIEARRNKNQLESLHEVFRDFTNSPISRSKMNEFLKKQKELVCLCKFLDQLQEHEITLIKSKTDYWALKRTKTAHVLFFSGKDLVNNTKLWNETLRLFFNVCAEKNESEICAAVHTDVFEELLIVEGIESEARIVVIEDQCYTTKDLLKKCNDKFKVKFEEAMKAVHKEMEQIELFHKSLKPIKMKRSPDDIDSDSDFPLYD